MESISRTDIWKQQKYNNSCAWDCFSMLLTKHGVETSTYNLVGSSHIPYQIRLHPEENRLSAGMLVQEDSTVNAVLGKYGFCLESRRPKTIAEYLALATELLCNGEIFITNLKRPCNLPGRHAVVFTEKRDSGFMGLDPDCRLDRTMDYKYTDVENIVTLNLTEDEFACAATGLDGYVPFIGVLSPCRPQEADEPFVKEVFKRSEEALEFYVSETKDLDFSSGESIQVIHSVLKPIVSDLRTAIEIRDKYLHHRLVIASFLTGFEKIILEFRSLIKSGEAITQELNIRLRDSVKMSYGILREHLSYEAQRT